MPLDTLRRLQSVGALRDLVSAMQFIRDPGERAALYPKVRPLLDSLPPALAEGPEGKEVRGRFVRVLAARRISRPWHGLQC